MILHKVKTSMVNEQINRGYKIFKSAYRIVFPILMPFTIFFLLVAFFQPTEGVNTYKIIRTVAIILFVVTVALFVTNKVLLHNKEYEFYENIITSKIRLNIWIPLAFMTLIVTLPFYILFVTSIKTSPEANSFVFTWWPKEGITFASYGNVIRDLDAIGINIYRTFLNTLFYATLPVIVSVLVSAISAYAFAKLYFPGRDVMFMFLLFTMMLPTSMNQSTSYMMYGTIGWLDFDAFSLPLTIPSLFGSVGTMFFLRNYYQGMPDSMFEAAKLDGCGKMKTFFSIMLPLGMPAIVVQFIMGFIGNYNNFTGALIYLKYPEQFTIARAIDFFDGQDNKVDPPLLAAASVLSLLPTLLLYAIFQKKILSGIQMSSGLKG